MLILGFLWEPGMCLEITGTLWQVFHVPVQRSSRWNHQPGLPVCPSAKVMWWKNHYPERSRILTPAAPQTVLCKDSFPNSLKLMFDKCRLGPASRICGSEGKLWDFNMISKWHPALSLKTDSSCRSESCVFIKHVEKIYYKPAILYTLLHLILSS